MAMIRPVDTTFFQDLFRTPETPSCVVCGVEYHSSRFCSTTCEDWLIDEYRSLVARDLATVMQGRRLKMRGEQVLLWA